MRKTKRPLKNFILTGLFILASTSPVWAAPPSEELQLKAYQALVHADAARDRDRALLATEHYRRSIQLYENLQRKAPAYKSQIVTYRIKYCANQIKSLNPNTGDPARVLQKERANMPRLQKQPNAKILVLEETVEQLSSRIESQTRALRDAVSAGDILQAQHEDLLKKFKESQFSLTSTRMQLAQAELKGSLVQENPETLAQVKALEALVEHQKVALLGAEAKQKEWGAQQKIREGEILSAEADKERLSKLLMKAAQKAAKGERELRQQIAVLGKGLADQEQQLERSGDDRDELLSAKTSLQSEMAKVRKNLAEAQKALKAETRRLIEAEEDQEQLEQSKGDVGRLEKELDALRKIQKTVGAALRKQSKTLNKAVEQIKDYEKQLADVSVGKVSLKKALEELKASRERSEELQTRYENRATALGEAEREVGRLETALTRIKQELDQLKTESMQSSRDNDTAKEEFESPRELETLRKILVKSEAEIQKSQLEIETLQTKVKVRENEVEELKLALLSPQDESEIRDNRLLQKRLESVHRELERYRKERDLFEAELKNVQKQAPRQSEDKEQELRNTIKLLGSQLKRIEREFASYRETAELLEKANPVLTHTDESVIKDLQLKLKNERERRRVITEILKEKNHKIQSLQSQVRKVGTMSSPIKNRPKETPTPVDEAPIVEALPPTKPIQAVTPSSKNYVNLTVSEHVELNQGPIREAIADFERAIELAPESPSAHLGLAGCYYTLGNLTQAKETAQKVLKIEATNPQALGLLSIIYWAEGDLNYASELINKALVSTQTDPQLYNYLGGIQHAQGNREKAIESWGKAVALDPAHNEAHFNLAVMYATSEPQNIEAARKHYEQALTFGSLRDDSLEQLLIP